MQRGPAAALAVSLFRQCVNSACINPAIVKIKKGAGGNGEVNRFIIPTGGAKRMHIFRRDPRRIFVYFANKTKERLVLVVQAGSFQIVQHAPNQFPVTGTFFNKQFRRDRGVGLQSKWALVPVRCERCD